MAVMTVVVKFFEFTHLRHLARSTIVRSNRKRATFLAVIFRRCGLSIGSDFAYTTSRFEILTFKLQFLLPRLSAFELHP